MRLSPRHLTIASAIVSAAVSLYFGSPVLRARLIDHSQRWFGWTDAARRADPSGFAGYVEDRLKGDLIKFQDARLAMSSAVADLNKKVDEYQHLAAKARELAEDFRDKHQEAVEQGTFPVTVHHAAYTEQQVEEQVSLLLAEALGYDQALAKMQSLQQTANEKLHAFIVRIDSTEAQLAMISTQRELLKSRELTSEGEKLVQQLDSLFDANAQALAGNPVRTVRELIASTTAGQSNPNLAAARKFLAEKRTVPSEPVKTETRTPTTPVLLPAPMDSPPPSSAVELEAAGREPEMKQGPSREEKPIFGQY